MQKLKDAIEQQKFVTITDQDGNRRIVEPYQIFTGKDSMLLHCYQTAGYSASGGTGWRNIKLVDIVGVTVGGSFVPRPEFKRR